MYIEKKYYTFKPIITQCSIDLPAKSKLQETKQFGGYNSCTYCDIPGELVVVENLKKNKKIIKKPKNAATVPQKKQNKFVRYVEGSGSYKLRGEVETLEKMLLASKFNGESPIDGIKDVSCLVSLEHFHIIWSISPEYMHSCLLGATKRMFDFFFNSKYSGKDYYIAPMKRKTLNMRILGIKPTSSIVRKPRSLKQRSNYKASEYRSMLLYYLPVVLPGCVPNVYVKHVRILSASVYTLLKDNISDVEVDDVEKILDSFVKEHQQLFGTESMVMVIHLLKHLAESVRRLGPLWCHSAFPFERNNGCLLKLVSGTSDVVHQISSKYSLSKSISKQQKRPDMETNILLGKSINMEETTTHVLSLSTFEILNFSNIILCVHSRIRLKNIVYTSLLYTRPKRTIDYFIGLENGMFGTAKYYFESDEQIYVVMTQFQTIDNIDHIIKVQSTNRSIVAPIDEIRRKYLFMKIGLNYYIVTPPNSFENE